MESKEIYSELESKLKALYEKEVLNSKVLYNKLMELVIDQIPETTIITLIKGKKPTEIQKMLRLPEGLDYSPIKKQGLKILQIMKDAKDSEDFEKKTSKKNIKKKPLTDFDKILKGIMKVPKQDQDKEAK